ncbi:MAG: hypothetical protein ACJ8FY_22620 [Gemmataceae bacterium]
MRSTISLLLAGVFVSACPLLKADDQADVKAIIDKSIKAHGADKLVKLKGLEMKMKGKFYGSGEGIDYTGEWNVQAPDKSRHEITGDVGGMKFTFLEVFSGDKVWRSINGQEMDADKDILEEAKEALYATWVAHLYPLKDKEFTLSPLGDAKVGDKEAVGVKVEHKGHRDVNLFFDKKSGYLIKEETRVKDTMGGGGEQSQETIYEDFKDVEGVKKPYRVVINRDGKKYVEGEITEIKLVEKIEDSVFAKP